MKEYKVVEGTYFNSKTPDVVCDILNTYLNQDKTIRVFYGDTETGRCWMDEYDTIGRVGRSMGPRKIPLLIKTKRSMGGGAILDNCIIRIQEGSRILYRHDKFHMPKVEATGCQVMFDGEVYANCKSVVQAQKLAAFMRGERNNKS